MRWTVEVPKEKVDEVLKNRILLLERENRALAKKVRDLELWKTQQKENADKVKEIYDKMMDVCRDYSDLDGG